MKWNAKAVFSAVLEYIVLLAPTIGYSVYAYVDTLQYELSETEQGAFWATFGLGITAVIVVSIGYSRFKTLYDRYCQGYIQQKTDLETHPNDELLLKKVSSKAKVIESLDYVVIALPVLIVTLLLYILQSAIVEVINILLIAGMSLLAKAGLHCLTVQLKVNGMKAIEKVADKVGDK